MDASLHCKKCKDTLRCKHYHLYVIELDFQLTKNKRFMQKNPHYKWDMDCLYVGSTSHTCYCRFKQHQLHSKKEERAFLCSCDGSPKIKKFVRSGGHTRGSYYPGVYGIMLRPDLFYRYNPVLKQESVFEMEEKLAETLRNRGFAVWQH